MTAIPPGGAHEGFGAYGLSDETSTPWLLGDPERALRTIARAGDLARELAHAFGGFLVRQREGKIGHVHRRLDRPLVALLLSPVMPRARRRPRKPARFEYVVPRSEAEALAILRRA